MAVKFLEPGGDATFNVAIVTNGGFWGNSLSGAPVVATDFVHGTHIKSIQSRANNADIFRTSSSVAADTGTRLSFYIYLVALPTSTATIAQNSNTTAQRESIRLTSSGVLQIWQGNPPANQIGTDGATLATGQWYRISLAYTITDNATNEFRLFVDGNLSISVSNQTLDNTGGTNLRFGNINTDATLDMRMSDFYVDDSSALTDTGNIWVTAKRPNANGLTNGFLVQIGAGDSGYGTGHSPQINERALDTADGWQTTLLGTTEEYTVESTAVGDINIYGMRIIDYVGWIYADASTSVTAQIIVGGSVSNVSLTTTKTMFTAVKGSTAYPGGGTDIGMISSGSISTESLYECGIMVAFIPPAGVFGNYSPYVKVGGGMSRNERST